jgi:hypothetical protein
MLRQSDAPMMAAAAEERTSALLAAGDFEGAATSTLRQHGPAVHRFLGALLGDWSLADEQATATSSPAPVSRRPR